MPAGLLDDYLGLAGFDLAEAMNAGNVVLLENCRCNKGEKKNDDALAQKMSMGIMISAWAV